MQLFTARVKFPAGKVFEGRYGDRQNVVVEGQNSEETIWFNAGNQFYSGLKRGQTVQVFNKGTAQKPQWRIVEPEREQAPPPPQQQRDDVGSDRVAAPDRIFQDLAHQAQVFEYIYRSVISQFERHQIPPGELTKIATTIYINHAKHQ